MLIAFLLILATVKVNSQSVDQDGLRKSKELNFDLQDIRNTDDEKPTPILQTLSPKDDIINDKLPPFFSSSSAEFVGTQNQQAFDFKSLNSVEKENECKPPFYNCDFKSDSKIPKPSRDLVPPLNDLEEELAVKGSIKLEKTKEEIKTTTQEQRKITSITEKVFTKTLKKVSPVNTSTFIITTKRPRSVTSKAEATNELRSYLPPQPEFSAAAQTNVAVVQPVGQNHGHDHNHHHGHHRDNFNLCEDAFHSFLCAPLKARKRITGALPDSLKGQSSFINYQKTLLNFDRETAPSNSFRNEYLPPKPSPTNSVQSTYLPPFTTKRPIVTTTTTTKSRPYSPPNIIPESSNSNHKLYLPPGSANSIQNSSFVKPSPSSQEYSTAKPSMTPAPTTFIKTTSGFTSNSLFQKVSPVQTPISLASPTALFSSVSSNGNNFYLPPNPNPQPSASFVSTSKNIFPITSTLSPLNSTFVPLPAVSTFAPLSSNSIPLSSKLILQPTFPVFTTTARPLISSSVFATTPSVIQLSSFASRPSSPVSAYVTQKIHFPSTSSTTTTKPIPSTLRYSEQSTSSDNSYLPPDLKEPAAAQISPAAVATPQVKNPFHHGRNLCNDPFHSFLCVSAKPRKKITGEIPLGFKSESSNTDEIKLKPEPSNQDENKTHSDKLLENGPAQNLGYKYPKLVNPFSTPSNVNFSTVPSSTAYSYPKPDKIFPLPSQESIKITSATPSNSNKSEPILNPSEARVPSGYQYPKPEKIFPQPAEKENIKITTTSFPSTGYSYAKPQKPFPLPTEQKEVLQSVKQKASSTPQPNFSLPTNQVRGYQYPKPDQSLKLPEKKGYSYPKPEKRLELPNESRSKFLLPQTNSNLDALRNLGSADFIPVNKIEYKRAEPSKLLMGLRRFGERMKKRERQAQLLKRQLH